ncbi:MAG: extracellular solute-binding protein [Chloroflexi bacterium]|nr:extracellular solute-binding protein [Chloroflexota bacterium]
MKRSRFSMIGVATAVFLVLLPGLGACSPGAPPAPAGTPAAPAAPVAVKAAWEQDWEQTLKAAKAEGTVFVYTGFGADFRTALSKAMKDKYDITTEFVSGRSAEIVERIMAEQRNQAYLADVVIIGSSQHQMTLWPAKADDSLKSVLLLPEVVDPKVWWEGRVPFVDREAMTVVQMYAYVQPPFAINTTMIKPDDLKSYKDLAKFKDKFVMDDPTLGSGPGIQQLALMGQYLTGWEYLEQLPKLGPILLRDRTQQLQWLGLGRYPILMGPEPDTTSAFKKTGAPVALVTPSEGASVTPGFGTVAQIRKAPHPNAAKVFINFLLTREGQLIASKSTMSQSARVDVPTDHLDPDVVRKPGVKYVSATDQEFMAVQVELYNKIIAIFRPLVK